MGHPRWELAGRQEMGIPNRNRRFRDTREEDLMGHPRPELAGRETGRGIYCGRLGIVGTGR